MTYIEKNYIAMVNAEIYADFIINADSMFKTENF